MPTLSTRHAAGSCADAALSPKDGASAAVSLGSERNESQLSLNLDAALGVEMTKTYPCFYSRDGLASGRKIDRTDFTPMLVKRKRRCRAMRTKHPHVRVWSMHAGGVLQSLAILEILPHRIPLGMSCLSPPPLSNLRSFCPTAMCRDTSECRALTSSRWT